METNKIRAAITAIGMFVPDKVLDNKYFESIVDTTDEWITTRTGIKERRIFEHGATSDMAVEACKDMFANFNVNPEEIDTIVVGTITPDMFFPSTACLLQAKIGAKNAWCFDVSAACSGFIYSLQVARSLIESGKSKKLLLIGADKMTAIADYTDRNTCILFGDAAAALLLEPTTEENIGIMDSIYYSDGNGSEALNMKAGGSLRPASIETVKNKMHYVYQDGKVVFKVAVKGMADVAVEIMQKNNLTPDDIAYLVPHQANMRIITATAERMKLVKEKVMINIHKYGNTTAATIPLCMAEYYKNKKLKKGDKLILTAFGAGYTWGSVYLIWSI
ncbi:MAG: ketoacyl-ACP synthase III [Ignavibacteriales bacterium]|nr:ketoacyl-ACP synthase III [Ignavibacteriales bacterium]